MRSFIERNLRALFLAAFALSIAGYTIYEARFLISGPKLTIFSPRNYATVADPLLEIKGRVKNISGMTANGRPVMITPDGLFADKLLLMPGYNTIELKVFNKFGQEKSQIIKIWQKK